MTKKIPLQNGMYVIVDKEDYERCISRKWVISTSYGTETKLSSSDNECLSLPRFIMGLSKGDKRIVTFRNRDFLDVRKCNLIVGSMSDAQYSAKGRGGSTSRYKGVSWDKSRRRWRADIKVNGKQVHLGRFENEEDAAQRYNQAVDELLDGKAYLNKIGEDNSTIKRDLEKINQSRKKHGASGFKGVYENTKGAKWTARIHGKHIGSYPTSKKAAKAYDKKAYELYGDKAILNFPELIGVKVD